MMSNPVYLKSAPIRLSQGDGRYQAVPVGRAGSKFAAIRPAVIDCDATSISIVLRVGSARAWNTSLLKFIA